MTNQYLMIFSLKDGYGKCGCWRYFDCYCISNYSVLVLIDRQLIVTQLTDCCVATCSFRNRFTAVKNLRL